RGDLAVDELARCKPLNRSRQAVPGHSAVRLHPNEHDLAHNRLVQQGHLRGHAMRRCFDASNLHELFSWIETSDGPAAFLTLVQPGEKSKYDRGHCIRSLHAPDK